MAGVENLLGLKTNSFAYSSIEYLAAFVPITSITRNTNYQIKNGEGYCRTDWNAAFLDNGDWNFSSVQDQQVNGNGGIIFENFYDI